MTYRPASLDALNFLLADVRGALGPFLVVYLTSRHGWTQADVGLMGAATGLAGVVLQTPAGAFIDRTTARRGVIVAALLVLSAGSLVLYATASFWAVTLSNGLISVVSDVFAPAVTALTLGLTARAALSRRIGRNSAFDHAGNLAIALAVGAVGTLASQRAIFLLVPVFTAVAVAATLSIPAAAIDNRRARGLDAAVGTENGKVAGLALLFRSRPLRVLAASVFLFHLANAAMLPLVGQELAARQPGSADGLMSLCIIAAQGVMLPLALLVGRKADRWGRKPIFLAAFLAALGSKRHRRDIERRGIMVEQQSARRWWSKQADLAGAAHQAKPNQQYACGPVLPPKRSLRDSSKSQVADSLVGLIIPTRWSTGLI